MSKVKISYDGKFNNETWELEMQDWAGTPSLTLTRGHKTLEVNFESPDEHRRFDNKIGLCRGYYLEAGVRREVYLTG